MAAVAAAPLTPAFANPAGTGLIISEVYVNGGSSGASYLNKFVELYNPTSSGLPLTGSTLQYRAATSTVVPGGAQVFALSGTVAPHGYFLIQLPSNNASTNPGEPPAHPRSDQHRQPGRGRWNALRRRQCDRRPAHRRRGRRQARLGHQQLAGGRGRDR
nr:hypothetical protein GCM10020092_101220 [Actinoplanes digitatis]